MEKQIFCRNNLNGETNILQKQLKWRNKYSVETLSINNNYIVESNYLRSEYAG